TAPALLTAAPSPQVLDDPSARRGRGERGRAAGRARGRPRARAGDRVERDRALLRRPPRPLLRRRRPQGLHQELEGVGMNTALVIVALVLLICLFPLGGRR